MGELGKSKFWVIAPWFLVIRFFTNDFLSAIYDPDEFIPLYLRSNQDEFDPLISIWYLMISLVDLFFFPSPSIISYFRYHMQLCRRNIIVNHLICIHLLEYLALKYFDMGERKNSWIEKLIVHLMKPNQSKICKNIWDLMIYRLWIVGA